MSGKRYGSVEFRAVQCGSGQFHDWKRFEWNRRPAVGAVDSSDVVAISGVDDGRALPWRFSVDLDSPRSAFRPIADTGPFRSKTRDAIQALRSAESLNVFVEDFIYRG